MQNITRGQIVRAIQRMKRTDSDFGLSSTERQYIDDMQLCVLRFWPASHYHITDAGMSFIADTDDDNWNEVI